MLMKRRVALTEKMRQTVSCCGLIDTQYSTIPFSNQSVCHENDDIIKDSPFSCLRGLDMESVGVFALEWWKEWQQQHPSSHGGYHNNKK